MNIKRVRGWLGAITVSLTLGIGAPANADPIVDILTVGDSLTRGSLNISGAPDRATYRPYLWQTARNYLDTVPGGNNGVDINFIGTEGPTAYTPDSTSGESVIPISGSWDMDHQGFGGATSQSFSRHNNGAVSNTRFIANVLDQMNTAGTTPDVAVILLSTNDLAILGNQSSNSTFLFNRTMVTDALSSIETVATILRDGYNGPYGPDHLNVVGNPDVQVLIAAVPPVDERQRFDGDVSNPSPPSNTFLWTENDRQQIVDTNFDQQPPGTFSQDFVTDSGGGNFVLGGGDGALSSTDSNHIIGVLNDELLALANDATKDPGDNWRFINTFEETFLINAAGTPVQVDGGGNFDQTGTGTSSNPDLVDGLHLSFTGDQYYAGNIWDGPSGLRSILDDAIAAQAIPEPSAFAFLGLLLTSGCVAKRLRKKRQQTSS